MAPDPPGRWGAPGEGTGTCVPPPGSRAAGVRGARPPCRGQAGLRAAARWAGGRGASPARGRMRRNRWAGCDALPGAGGDGDSRYLDEIPSAFLGQAARRR